VRRSSGGFWPALTYTSSPDCGLNAATKSVMNLDGGACFTILVDHGERDHRRDGGEHCGEEPSLRSRGSVAHQ